MSGSGGPRTSRRTSTGSGGRAVRPACSAATSGRPTCRHTCGGTWGPSAAPARTARDSTVVVLDGSRTWALCDGRATAEENWDERTGLAVTAEDRFTAVVDAPLLQSPHPPFGLRSCDVVPLPDGGARWFYEATRSDGAHELRTVLLPG